MKLSTPSPAKPWTRHSLPPRVGAVLPSLRPCARRRRATERAKEGGCSLSGSHQFEKLLRREDVCVSSNIRPSCVGPPLPRLQDLLKVKGSIFTMSPKSACSNLGLFSLSLIYQPDLKTPKNRAPGVQLIGQVDATWKPVAERSQSLGRKAAVRVWAIS